MGTKIYKKNPHKIPTWDPKKREKYKIQKNTKIRKQTKTGWGPKSITKIPIKAPPLPKKIKIQKISQSSQPHQYQQDPIAIKSITIVDQKQNIKNKKSKKQKLKLKKLQKTVIKIYKNTKENKQKSQVRKTTKLSRRALLYGSWIDYWAVTSKDRNKSVHILIGNRKDRQAMKLLHLNSRH